MLHMLQLPPSFTKKLEKVVEVSQDEPLELKCSVDGSPVPIATWYKDGEEVKPSKQ